MMMARGHEVFLYASEDNEAACTELINCITKEDQATYGFAGPKDYLKIDFNPTQMIWRLFNTNVVGHMRERLQKEDFICVISGRSAEIIAKTYPEYMTVEFGIGYSGTFSKYRVFESYSWMHYIYGLNDGAKGGNDSDGNFYDAAIANYFEVDDFPFGKEKEDYFLYIGRLTDRKGYRIAIEVCQKLGLKLKIAGYGDPPEYGEYVGMVGPKERGELMSKARAVFVPTMYIGPFEGVSVEAMLCGTPVITTDWGAFTENVRQGVDGFRCRSFAEFCDATKNVDSLDYAEIRHHAIVKYSVDAIGLQYEKYFEHLATLWRDGWYTAPK